MWQNGPDMLPTTLQPYEGKEFFDKAKLVGATRLDNCFAGWDGKATIGVSLGWL